MPKKPQDLTHRAVINEKRPGCHRAAENLYLQIDDNGNKSWLFRYMIDGKSRKMGLGAFGSLSLADAREEAEKCRKQVKTGIEPLTARKEERAKARQASELAKAKGKTFTQCAEAYIAAHKDGWKNAKHIWQWSNSLEKFVYPTIGHLSVQSVDVALIMEVLEPIWKTKTETATRVRGRIESILDWARVREYRQGENPARWRGHLENLLPKPSKVQKITHYPSLSYAEIHAFMSSLKTREALSGQALQLLIYTAARSGEIINAKWNEFDLKERVWTIPAVRTKTEREHRVPLSQPATDILAAMSKDKVSQYLFPDKSLKKPLSNMAMLVLIRRMNGEKAKWQDSKTKEPIVAHGFRSTFRTWCAEQTNYPREVAEAALGHITGDKVEAAYQRGDLFEKRRRLMDEWAKYCATPFIKRGSVAPLRSTHQA